MTRTNGRDYWTRRVFIEQSSLYGEILEAGRPAAVPQVRSLRRLFKSEGIPPTGRILDIACGVGRHIVPLAQAGYTAVGCDFSPGFIERARTWARRARLNPNRLRFYVADYRRVDRTLRRAREPPFDAAVCLFTSMGHYGEQGDLVVLRAVRRTVRPGGLFVLEMGNRDWILRHFEPRGRNRVTKGIELRERRRFDWETSTVFSDWSFFRIEGRRRRKVFDQQISVRLYSLHELRHLFERAGWDYLRAYGDLATMEPVARQSHRLVVVARRPRDGAHSGR